MFISNDNIVKETLEQSEKENYIANMLVNTLYSNSVNHSECHRIIQLFAKKVLGNIEVDV